MKKVLFVCLGNICRSPLGEGILQAIIDREGLDWETDSAGTAGYHVGELPDSRSVAIAKERGIDITYQRSRKFIAQDFDRFDHILVMDKSNKRNVLNLARTAEHEAKVELMLDYGNSGITEVPDPYYEGGFDYVFDIVKEAVEDFISKH